MGCVGFVITEVLNKANRYTQSLLGILEDVIGYLFKMEHACPAQKSLISSWNSV